MVEGTDNVVQGNYIGVDATGAAALPPNAATNGIEVGLAGAATNTLIGGDAAGAGNVIVGANVAINLHGNGSSGATIQGNHIGVNAAGDAALGAGVLGIEAFEMPDITIGGSTPVAGNVMAGFANVVNVGNGATNVVIQGNHIGIDASGTRPIGSTATRSSSAYPATAASSAARIPAKATRSPTAAERASFSAAPIIGRFSATRFRRPLGISLQTPD